MQLHEYQKVARLFLLDHVYRHGGGGLFQDLGLGKTRTVLYTLKTLFDFREIRKVLVVAPLRVCHMGVWQDESKLLKLPFTFRILHGAKKGTYLREHADIHLINTDGVKWLSKQKAEYDLMVVDEISNFRNWSSQRTKALRRLSLGVPRRIGLTATPTPNQMGEVFAPQFILDHGKVLGTTIGAFRSRYMQLGGFENRDWIMRPEMVAPLQKAISPYWLHQSALEHLDMPPVINNEIMVELPPKAKEYYKQMQKEMYAELEGGKGIVAFSGGSRYSICRQLASGACYMDGRTSVAQIHDAKMDALAEILDGLNGKSIIVAYNFTHEMERIKKRWPKCEVVCGGVSGKESQRILDAFKSGECKMLVAQCQSMSHGVNGLQHVCNDACWFSPTDQPEIRQQFEGRLWRQGVRGQVRFHHLLVKGTVELSIKRTLDDKRNSQRDVLKAIKEARE